MATRKNKRGKKQRIIYMKGCSRKRHLGGRKCLKGGSNDPIAPLKMNGGSSLPPVPAPLVGNPWTPQVSGWPGVDGVDSGRNYLANNLYNQFDPQTMMKLDSTLIGGSKRRRRKYSKKQHGGSFMPQQLTNLGRDLSFNFKSAYNSMNGYSAPVNPKPYMDQFRSTEMLL
jgi:hypothetical protein